MRPTQGIILCLLAATLAAPRLAAQTDTLSSAREALKAKDYANAINLYQQYLQENLDAPDAPKTAMLVGYITDAAKATSLDVRAAFQAVRDKYPNSDEAKEALFRIGMLKIREKDHEAAKAVFQSVLKEDPKSAAASWARFSLASYQIRDARLDDAIDLFAQVAADPRIGPAMQDEALLQTGFLYIQKYFAPRLILPNGQVAPASTGESQVALLETARMRLEKIAGDLDRKIDNPTVHQTAAAYAECGVAEVYLLQSLPDRAERWYRAALARRPDQVQAPVRTLAALGLGVSLYRLGRYISADEAFDLVLNQPATGVVLYGLLVPEFCVSQARLWKVVVLSHMGLRKEALRSLETSVEALQATVMDDHERLVLRASMEWSEYLQGHWKTAPRELIASNALETATVAATRSITPVTAHAYSGSAAIALGGTK